VTVCVANQFDLSHTHCDTHTHTHTHTHTDAAADSAALFDIVPLDAVRMFAFVSFPCGPIA